jgi:hypothetical protein
VHLLERKLHTVRAISGFDLEYLLYAPATSSVWTLQFAHTVHLCSLLRFQNKAVVTFKAAVSLKTRKLACKQGRKNVCSIYMNFMIRYIIQPNPHNSDI